MTQEIKPTTAVNYDIYCTAMRDCDELREFVVRCMDESGLSRCVIAKRLGMQVSTLKKKTTKANFTINDANMILGAINPRLGVQASVTWRRNLWRENDEKGDNRP